jgi:hypothetical protein
MTGYNLAQLNIGILKAPMDAPDAQVPPAPILDECA